MKTVKLFFSAAIWPLALVSVILMSREAGAENCVAESGAHPYSTHEVSESGLVAQFFRPSSKGPHPAILVLGGSEGGTEGVRDFAAPVAEQGYAVLALSYFGAEGLPANLEEIPVEYFMSAVTWLTQQASVNANAIGVFGISKGAEAALVLAAHDTRLKVVSASAPSHVMWQNINYREFTPRPSWTLEGKDLPFVPYYLDEGFISVFGLYDGALKKQDRYLDAEIPVEQINGPIFLVSGDKDTLWPSSFMAERIVKRLTEKNFSHPVQHLRYANAGHVVGSPPSLGGQASMFGGSEAGNAAAREEMWSKMLCFFNQNLGR